jgi:hypothetical protein
MAIFGNIASAIFGKSAGAFAPQGTATAGGDPATATNKVMTLEEVEAMLAKRAATKDQALDWRRSIVDLMKLCDVDASLAARKRLAQELGYTGSLDGSAEMNIWLHKQVMHSLAEGKPPGPPVT